MAAPVIAQIWQDVVFLHWETDPDEAARRMPAGTSVDLWDGRCFIGVVALRLVQQRVGPLPTPGMAFGEVNVRLYSVDDEGRHGVVFCAMDAGSLPAVTAARAGLRLPYCWSRVALTRDANLTAYAVQRRHPPLNRPDTPPRPAAEIRVTRAAAPTAPTPLQEWLTARYGLHWSAWGRTCWAPVEHPPWTLHPARCATDVTGWVNAVGLPVSGEPLDVLWSPGVATRIGLPRFVVRRRAGQG